MSRIVQSIPQFFFASCAVLTAVVTIFFVSYIFYVAYPTFVSQGLINFLTGSVWDYSENVYGIRIFIAGTMILTAVTLILAVPLGIFTAIFMSEIAPKQVTSVMRPLIELLVGIPSVVYGVFGLYVLGSIFRDHIAPFISSTFSFIPFFRAGSADGAGLALASTVLAIMILPTIISISEDSIRAVKKEYREASFALGATRWETISQVVLPAASKGIMAAVILGMMRAMGETMAIVMLFGNVITIPNSFFGYGYAMTSKILNDIGYYVAFEEPKSALFAIAAVLFAMEIVFVAAARKIGGRV
jgi:phosphate transport system permease protein